MKQLPDKIALDKAVHGQRCYQGEVKLKQMVRLKDLLADDAGSAEFSIQFGKAVKLLGKAQIKIKTNLPLICTISAKKFLLPIEINTTIGFIDDLAYEAFLSTGMEASWVENGVVKPLDLIEDELILAVPDAPFDENIETDISENSNEKEISQPISNPFAVLKSLK